jgi:hypothetical protein
MNFYILLINKFIFIFKGIHWNKWKNYNSSIYFEIDDELNQSINNSKVGELDK